MPTANMPTLHICTPKSCPVGANYFVTAIDGSTVYYMAGPYSAHYKALEMVDVCRGIAYKNDGRAWFMSWGTAKSSRTERGSMTRLGLL